MSIFTYIKRHSFVTIVTAVFLIIIVILAGRAANRKPATDVNTGPKKVTTVNVGSFRKGNLNVSADGTVQSHSQADLKSQMSAPVATINVSIGDAVSAGQTILELQNSDIRAQLAQSLASLDLAKGQRQTGAVSLDSAKQGAIDKVRDAYVKTYDAISTQIDPILYNNDGNGGRLQSYIIDTKLNSEITSIDLDFKYSFDTWKTSVNSLTVNSPLLDIEGAITVAQTRVASADQLLGDISKALNDSSRFATPSFAASLAVWKGTVSGARATLSGVAQGLTGAANALGTSNTSQDSTAQAQVSLAEAGVNNLQAQLAKTIIRSPINGKISALPLREGEYASPGQLLATVVGGGGLQVKAYVGSEDLSRVKIGAEVDIKDGVKGIVSNVSPSVDAATKKAEIIIDVTDPDKSGLVVGQNISVSIVVQKPSTVANQAANVSEPSSYLLPIQDVKIIPGSAYVFTIDENSKVKRNDVTLGDVQGDFIEVKAGLSDDMNIISPVYELDEGQLVSNE